MRYLLTIILSCLLINSYSQHLILKKLDVFTQNEQVHLEWVIKGGFQCNGTFIERAEDTINFERIGDIPGICGGDDEVAYSFIDEEPIFNKKSYYRLIMGNQGPSDHIQIEVLRFNSGLTVLSNPLEGSSRIIFENRTNERFYLNVYHISGRLALQRETTGNSIYIYESELNTGHYLLHLINGNGRMQSGKLIVP